MAHLEWKNGLLVNLLDTPGYADFVADAKSGLAVADAALMLVDGVAGVEVLTAKDLPLVDASSRDLPVAFVVNKLDRERASFDRCRRRAEIQERFGREAVPIQLARRQGGGRLLRA